MLFWISCRNSSTAAGNLSSNYGSQQRGLTAVCSTAASSPAASSPAVYSPAVLACINKRTGGGREKPLRNPPRREAPSSSLPFSNTGRCRSIPPSHKLRSQTDGFSNRPLNRLRHKLHAHGDQEYRHRCRLPHLH